jgi:hypothetical protein
MAKKVSKKVSKDAPKKKTGVPSRNVQLYKALRAEGITKHKAARIAKKVSATPPVTAAQATAAPVAEAQVTAAPVAEAASEYDASAGLDTWTKADLLAHAREKDLPGRSTMSKGELLEALRAREHANA